MEGKWGVKEKTLERKGQGKEKNEGIRNEEVVEKWEGVEGNKVSDNFIHPWPIHC